MLAYTESLNHKNLVNNIVSNWLKERQELIVQVFSLTQSSPLLNRNADISSLCEVLMDYVSVGHFEVFDEILLEIEQLGQKACQRSKELFNQLQSTTDAALRFNDLFEGISWGQSTCSLNEELETLTIELEKRFEIEDQLISLCNSLKEPQAA